ncbi:2-amino-4-hydroxy-6-hydroxymethyldihydropteridine diphosphokinase [Sphaerotilus mobilis]|uniref:2-amino-4-hydroxy-6-hydroxymethyldihydropteridine pyrophosphokinase n=1 Tax=Sphaerotilus mobilis TaxID=47994 RepID=A0A4Q7LDG1_9BURK|nr:2-amino-4-hydroxy-6-hydroxymethyldihydropteridine diphosphokinase [Sphaerotilus mobilis]RZS51973.1 2-amino-4-hydroxy-6-hydroxymethyldihydropteridine diphosphokinase [Sphaerotilus mobilis]
MDTTVRCHVALGANLGDLHATLDAACAALREQPGCRWIGESARYRSAPIDSSGPEYLNSVVALDVRDDDARAPWHLLAALQAIEARHGRERPYRNAPRTLDLDLLLWGDRVIDDAVLTVPHPRLHLRAFVLRPLLDLAPDLVLPGLGRARDHLDAVANQAIERLA